MAKPPRNLGTFEEHLKEDVSRQLLWNERVDSTDIRVVVRHDTVILEGSVPTEEARRHAEELARAVPGAGLVENRLAVRQ